MGKFSVAFAVFALSSLAISEAAVYIGGGCYDCKAKFNGDKYVFEIITNK